MASLFFSFIVKQYFIYHNLIIPHPTPTIYETRKTCLDWIFQGYNARKVISEVYPSFVLQCTVSARCNVNTRRITKPDMGSIFRIKNQWNIQVIENYYVNYQNYQNLMLLTSSDIKRTLMHLFLFINSTQRELVSYVRRVYATAIKFPCIVTLKFSKFSFSLISYSKMSFLNLRINSVRSWFGPQEKGEGRMWGKGGENEEGRRRGGEKDEDEGD